MEPREIVELVRPIVEGRGLRLAVLFGSGARGRLRQDSDLDIGIVPLDPATPLGDELDLQASGRSAAWSPLQFTTEGMESKRSARLEASDFAKM